jgi:iduronate 2-sulfatase
VSAAAGRPSRSEDVPDNAYEDGAIADRGVQWIKEHAKDDQPFFIAVGFKKPHLPFVAPKEVLGSLRQGYNRAGGIYRTGERKSELSPITTSANCGPTPVYRARERLILTVQKTLIHGYYACVSFIDAQVAKLLKALDESGEREDTIIVLWGDHGFHLGDHGLWCKHTNYEQATRAPMVFAGPGVKSRSC